VVAMKSVVFWVITLCSSWLGVSEEHIIRSIQSERGYLLLLLFCLPYSSTLKEGSDIFLRNKATRLHNTEFPVYVFFIRMKDTLFSKVPSGILLQRLRKSRLIIPTVQLPNAKEMQYRPDQRHASKCRQQQQTIFL
jgi:hypothetical protein